MLMMVGRIMTPRINAVVKRLNPVPPNHSRTNGTMTIKPK